MASSPFRIALTCAAATVLLALVESSNLAGLSAPQQPGQPVPSFRGGTTVIQVDVIVRDKQRQFVADLRTDDFEVLEDGVPQKISALYQVIGPGEHVEASSVAAPGRPALPAPPPQQIQRVLVIYFDQAHLAPASFDRARKAALGFLQDDFRAGDVGGIVNLSSMVNNRLTSSRAELEAAVQGMKASPEGADLTRELRTWPRFVDIVEALRVTRSERGYNPGPYVLDDVVARACRDNPSDCVNAEQEAQSKAIRLVNQARLTGKQTLDTVTAISNGLARLPGHKTLILLSDGFFTEDTWADLRDVVGRAARASVRIYSLDTRGLNKGSSSGDIISAPAPLQAEMSVMSVGDIGSDGPNSLAVDTGGYVIRNENDFGKAFTEFDRDTSSYYIIGFVASKPPDGKFHELKVSVRRSGLSVRARKGYVAYTDAAKADAQPSLTTPAAPVSPIRPAPGEATSRAGAQPAAAAPGPPAPAPAAAPPTPAARAEAPAGAVRLTPRSAEEIEASGGGVLKPGSDDSIPAALKKQASDGWTAYSKGDVEKAKALLTTVAEEKSAPPWTQYVLGWSELALGEAAPAAANWEKVRAAVPQFEAVYFDLADAYRRQGDLSKAVAVMRDSQQRWPNDVEVYSALGVIQLARGAVDDAIATFTKGVAINDKDTNVCYNLAKTYEVRAARTERARNTASASISLDSVRQDRTRAIEYYQRVVTLGGTLVDAAKEGLKRLGQ